MYSLLLGMTKNMKLARAIKWRASIQCHRSILILIYMFFDDRKKKGLANASLRFWLGYRDRIENSLKWAGNCTDCKNINQFITHPWVWLLFILQKYSTLCHQPITQLVDYSLYTRPCRSVIPNLLKYAEHPKIK